MVSKERQRGFTLMEIVIVLAILAILGTIGVTAYQGLQERTKDNTAKKQLSVIEDAYLYALTIKGSQAEAAMAVDDLIPEEMRSQYKIILSGSRYTITYQANGKTYTLEDGKITISE